MRLVCRSVAAHPVSVGAQAHRLLLMFEQSLSAVVSQPVLHSAWSLCLARINQSSRWLATLTASVCVHMSSLQSTVPKREAKLPPGLAAKSAGGAVSTGGAPAAAQSAVRAATTEQYIELLNSIP